MDRQPMRRSALYVPASNVRAVEKARSIQSDVVILDLEDSVAPEMKALARANAVAYAKAGGFESGEVVIRVNALESEWGYDDLVAVAAVPCDAILLPKISSAADLAPYREHLGDRPLWVMIETARSLLRLEEIARAEGIAAMVFGSNDLAKELRIRPAAAPDAFRPVLLQIVFAGRSFGVAVLDGVFNNIDDLAGFQKQCRAAADIGFDGKTLIHPSQVAPCLAAFAPTGEEVSWAKRICDAFDQPENANKGVVRIEGQMVERLHLRQAVELLSRYALD